MRRLRAALARRWRLTAVRRSYPSVRFGSGCDVRAGLSLTAGPQGSVEFGPDCVLDRGLTIEAEGRLSVGARTIFGHHCTLAARDVLEIGEDCLLAEMVSVRDHDHCFERLDIPIREQGAASAPVKIGRNVWLGAKVTVVKGVTIGDNAIVGANAVVTKDIPPNAIAAGVPARVLRFRE